MSSLFLNRIRPWFSAWLGLLYPEVCQRCRHSRATAAQGFICSGCRGDVKWIEPPFCQRCGQPYPGAIATRFECANCQDTVLHFDQARAAVAFIGLVREVIHRYKYQRALWFEPFLAELLIARAAPVLRQETWSFIVPVPLHRLKHRAREFNQAERLARHLSKATLIPLQTSLLKRTYFTPSQTHLSRAERTGNVQDAFTALKPDCLKQRSIVLVDDILTTGATTNACARVLRAAGAARVCVWTLARGLLN